MPHHESGALFDDRAIGWDDQRVWPCFPEKLARVAAAGAPPPGGTLLDAGTGTGVLIPDLLAHQPQVVWACDVSSEMLKQVRAKFGDEPRMRPMQADAIRLDLASDSVDAAYWNALYPHLADKEATLREARRVLKPGGRLVISHLIGRQRVNEVHHEAGGALRHHMLPPAETVCDLMLEMGFAILKAEDEERFYLIVAQKEAKA